MMLEIYKVIDVVGEHPPVEAYVQIGQSQAMLSPKGSR